MAASPPGLVFFTICIDPNLDPGLDVNIYRPPKDLNNNYKQSIHELTPTLKSHEKIKSNAIIPGGFNIDLLKINDREVFR